MAAVLVAIVFVIWNICCFRLYFFIPKIIKKMDVGIQEVSQLEPDKHIFRMLLPIIMLGSQLWKVAARPLITISIVIVDIFLIISFLQSFH